MIKRYNQFIKKTNESSIEPEVDELTSLSTDSIEDTNSNYSEEGVEDTLEYLYKNLGDTLGGAELMNNILTYEDPETKVVHSITKPSEHNQFEVDGVRLTSSEEVIDYLNDPQAQAEAQSKRERRQKAQSRRSQVQNAGEEQAPVITPNPTTAPLPDTTETDRGKTREEKREERYRTNKPAVEQDPLAKVKKFGTQTGKDPEEEAQSGNVVDLNKIEEVQFESKSYKSRFRTKF
jgi:hypothetical protein